MKNIVGIIDELSQTLQRKDQDIINMMDLVKVSKRESLVDKISSFYERHSIDIPKIDDIFVIRGHIIIKTSYFIP